jgi:hypothetical protein
MGVTIGAAGSVVGDGIGAADNAWHENIKIELTSTNTNNLYRNLIS